MDSLLSPMCIVEQNNVIHFNSEINARSISILIEKLTELEQRALKRERKLKRKYKDLTKHDDDDDQVAVEVSVKPKPIMLYITTNGGAAYQVFAAIDTIKKLKVPVHTVCKGIVASAGTLLSLAGEKRYITENSYMMIHELRGAHWGTFTQMTDQYENSRALMDHVRKYYLANTKMGEEELEETFKHDRCWNAEKCLEKGLVDSLL